VVAWKAAAVDLSGHRNRCDRPLAEIPESTMAQQTLDQLLAQFLPGLVHEREALGSPFLDPRLHLMGAYGVNDQRH